MNNARNMTMILRTLTLAMTVATFGACTGMVAQAQIYQRNQIINYGDWELSVESELTREGIQGIVEADGCTEIEVVADEQPDDPNRVGPATTTETHCERFPVSNALVRVIVNDVVVSRRTDGNGRFYIRSGSDLARITGAGNSGMVEATYHGTVAQSRLTMGALDEVAALASLEEMEQPTVMMLHDFVLEWRGTDAAELALERYGDVACHGFRADWNDMMASGDVDAMSAIASTYDSDWQEVFCEPCAAECRMLAVLPDLSSEVGSLQ